MDGAFDRDTGMAMLQKLCSSKKSVCPLQRNIDGGTHTVPICCDDAGIPNFHR